MFNTSRLVLAERSGGFQNAIIVDYHVKAMYV